MHACSADHGRTGVHCCCVRAPALPPCNPAVCALTPPRWCSTMQPLRALQPAPRVRSGVSRRVHQEGQLQQRVHSKVQGVSTRLSGAALGGQHPPRGLVGGCVPGRAAPTSGLASHAAYMPVRCCCLLPARLRACPLHSCSQLSMLRPYRQEWQAGQHPWCSPRSPTKAIHKLCLSIGSCTHPTGCPLTLQVLVHKRPKYFMSSEGVKCPRTAGSGGGDGGAAGNSKGTKSSKGKGAAVVAGGCPGTCVGKWLVGGQAGWCANW